MVNLKKLLSNVLTELAHGGHLLSLGSVMIIWSIAYIANLELPITTYLISYFLPQCVYVFDSYKGIKTEFKSNPERVSYLETQEKKIKILLIIYVLGLAISLLFSNLLVIVTVLTIISAGFLYTLIVKKKVNKIVGFKNFYTSLFWAIELFIVPFSVNMHLNTYFLLLSFFFFIRVFLNAIFFDLKDIDDDKKEGISTFPISFGSKKTLMFLNILNVLSMLPILLGIFYGLYSLTYLSFALIPIYSLIYLIGAMNSDEKKIRNFAYYFSNTECFVWPLVALLIK